MKHEFDQLAEAEPVNEHSQRAINKDIIVQDISSQAEKSTLRIMSPT